MALAYDLAGNRVRMTETDGAGPVRETSYSYDAARRLVAVGFDTDGDGTLDDTVSYAYDAGGLRTTLTLSGNLSVTYIYDARGQLVGLTDWDDQPVRYAYDQAGRLVLIDRAAAFQSRYRYDAAGRLRELQHRRGSQVLAPLHLRRTDGTR